MNCYILTGGRSTRMGTSKTDLFLGRVAAAAAQVFEEVVAVQRPDGGALAIPTLRESPHPGEAPVFGVCRALEDAGGRCVILAVDYPRITPEFLSRLRARTEASEALLVVPVWKGIAQPLCAGYDPAVLPRIERRIAEGKLDLLGLLADVRTERLEHDGPELLNVNTARDLEEAESQT